MRRARLGVLATLLLTQSVAYAQGILEPEAPEAPDSPRLETDLEAAMRSRVAAEFPDVTTLRFRNIRRIRTEAGHEVEFCGQVNAIEVGEPQPRYRVFLYNRDGATENLRILGADELNGYRIGRKLIGALRRVGCM